ncbi:MAG: hypothetical protein RIS22_319 [Actinomycetota bacterium]|jgi:hypothetical protein
MFELLLILIIIGLLLRRRDKRKRGKSIDAELHKMIEDVRESEITANEIRQFLLDVINDNKQDVEKFSDVRLRQASEMMERIGPGAFYWMTDIAATLASGYAARINGVLTNVDEELGESATPEAIVRVVVQI